MSFFLCKLWPYLAGGLIGWLLSGWLARKLKYAGSAATVEKLVDNPDHLKRISLLEKENAEISGLRSQISSIKSDSGKTVDNPEHLKRIAALEKENTEIATLRSKVKSLEGAGPKTVTVDNPDHIKRISELEGQLDNIGQAQNIDIKAAKVAGIKVNGDGDFEAIEGVGPKINDIIHNGGIKTFNALSDSSPTKLQSLLDDAGSRYNMANPGTWPDQANLAANNRWGALKALQDVLDGGVYPDGSAKSGGDQSKRIGELEAELAKYQKVSTQEIEVDSDAAKTAGFKLKGSAGQHDFTVVEGIGPKINEIIHNANIHTYTALAATSVADIQKLLDDAGPRYSLADPGTWPDQSDMAASNKWTELMKWQDELDGGKA